MLSLQVLTALHILAACVFVGSCIFLLRVTRRAVAIPPREAARLSELLGVDVAVIAVLGLGILGATGLLRMMIQSEVGRVFEWSFVSTAYGAALVVMILLWAVAVVAMLLMIFYFRPRLKIQLPYDSSRQVLDGRGAELVAKREKDSKRRQPGALVRDFLSLEGSTVPGFLALRRSLERKAAALAAKRRTPEEVVELERIGEAMKAEGLSDEEYVRLDAALHATILRAARDPELARRYSTVQPLFAAYSLRVLRLPQRREIASEGHERLIRAVVAGDARGARKEMTHHIDAVRTEVADYVEAVDHLDELQIQQMRSDAWVKRLVVFTVVIGVLTLIEAGFLSNGGFV
jgi:DNA-binding FadR family transcriptional regulator